MLQKRQIRAFKFNVFVALLLGFATIFPFRTLPIENGYELGILLKTFIFPLMIILLSLKANVIKYRELKDCRLRSKVVNVMSYLPVLIYTLALLTSNIQLLTVGIEEEIVSVLNPLTYSLIFTILVAVAFSILVITKYINKIILNANLNKLISIDVFSVVVLVLTILVFYSMNNTYHNVLNGMEIYHKGNITLLVFLVIGFVCFFRLHTKVRRVFNENETHINMNVSEVLEYKPSVETKNAEYRRSFKQIKREFGAFLIKENESDVQENQSETLVNE